MQLRTSSSISPYREKAEKALGLARYDWKTADYNVPVVFLGLYHKGDYESFLRPRIKRYVLWSGGDIQNFKRGYLYSDGQGLWKSIITSPFFGKWRKKIIQAEAEHFCENKAQQAELKRLGIDAEVVPAFWGDINEFPISFKYSRPFRVYICGHPGREKEYGLDIVERIAKELPDIEWHTYSAFVMPEEEFNEEIKDYHCFLRLNEHDGFSDALSKSILMGQYQITKIEYEMIDSFKTEEQLISLINKIKNKKEPNFKVREYWLNKFNKYPFLR